MYSVDWNTVAMIMIMIVVTVAMTIGHESMEWFPHRLLGVCFPSLVALIFAPKPDSAFLSDR